MIQKFKIYPYLMLKTGLEQHFSRMYVKLASKSDLSFTL